MLTLNLLAPRAGKRCTKCSGFGPFARRTDGAADGYYPWCTTCTAKYKAAQYEANREIVKARAKVWAAQNPAAKRRISNAWNARNLESQRAKHRKYLYGITADTVHEMWLDQGGRCAICPTEIRELGRGGKGKVNAIHVDHDHKTGKVRGLLCHRCNVAIGMMGDDPVVVLRASEYLQRAR